MSLPALHIWSHFSRTERLELGQIGKRASFNINFQVLSRILKGILGWTLTRPRLTIWQLLDAWCFYLVKKKKKNPFTSGPRIFYYYQIATIFFFFSFDTIKCKLF